jgi:hypothetical protein
MCGPMAFAAVGLAMSAYGTYQQGQSQKSMANYNARIAENNAQINEIEAQDAIKRGDEEANAIRRNADMLKGSQRASMAARGLDLAEGTAAELQFQTDFFSSVDQATARDNAKRQAWSIRTQGANFKSEAAMQHATAKSINPWMNTAGSLLTNGGMVASKWYKPARGGAPTDSVFFSGSGGMGD